MQKVLHLLNYLGNGGTEVYIYSLAKKLHNKKCQFVIAYSEDGIGREMFEELDIELIHIEMKSPFDMNAAKKLKKICKELSIGVIHSHFLRENYISILSKIIGNNVKLIHTRHMLLENSKSVILTNKIMTSKDDIIIAVSEKVKEQLIEEKISKKKIKLIYTGIDLKEWNQPIPLTFRDEYNINKTTIVIASVARFTEEKGHEFLLDSIRLLVDYCINKKDIATLDFKFVLTGDGQLLNTIKQRAIELNLEDYIIFTGFRRDIKNILKSSDIFISHSKSEAFGISILEAMAAAIPVLTTDSGGASEIINEKNGNGFLIDYGDKNAFVELLTKLIIDEDLRKTLGQRAHNHLNENFNLDTTVKNTLQVYGI